MSLNDPEHDDAEGWCKTVMNYTKGRIAELIVEEQSPAPRVEEHSDSDSLYDVDENIDDLSDFDEELLQARQSNIQEQVKEKTDRVNLDEIPSGLVGIDAGFEDIYKEMRGKFEDNLGGDDPYFDSSDPDSDISEDK
uniref:Transposon MuDR mudrA n=1 Tax=Solanum tuberosum TaxID=4113 RepID=M1DFD7_SOLTU